VRRVRLKRAGPKVEVLAERDGEAGGLDSSGGVASRVAAAAEGRPQATAVGELEERALGLTFGDDVLVEAQLAAGSQHAVQLRERARLVGNGAEDKARDGGVDIAVAERQVVGRAGPDRHRDGRGGRGARAAARSVGSGSIAITSVTLAG
jgi:hypothetical protein